jgi:hypothetical protein
MEQEILIHGTLTLIALALFALAAKSYWRDRHPRFRYVCLAFAVFLCRQLYMLIMAIASAQHGLPLITDTLDVIMVVLFLLAVKS